MKWHKAPASALTYHCLNGLHYDCKHGDNIECGCICHKPQEE